MRIFAIAILTLALALAPSASRADQEDSNILNWAPVSEPGPQPPIDLPAIEAYAPDVTRPRAAIDGRIAVSFRDGGEVTCLYPDMDVIALPVTSYTLWLIKTYAMYARSQKVAAGRFWDMPGVPSILGPTNPTVLRARRCGGPWRDGYFRIPSLPTGKYMIISTIFHEVQQAGTTFYDYTPGVIGIWSSRTMPGGRKATDCYVLYSSVDIPRGGNLVYHVPRFQVIAHYDTPR